RGDAPEPAGRREVGVPARGRSRTGEPQGIGRAHDARGAAQYGTGEGTGRGDRRGRRQRKKALEVSGEAGRVSSLVHPGRGTHHSRQSPLVPASHAGTREFLLLTSESQWKRLPSIASAATAPCRKDFSVTGPVAHPSHRDGTLVSRIRASSESAWL